MLMQNTRTGASVRPGASPAAASTRTRHGHPTATDDVRQLVRCRDLFSTAVDIARGDARHGTPPRFDDSLIEACLMLSQAERCALLGLLGEARDLLIETQVKKELLG